MRPERRYSVFVTIPADADDRPDDDCLPELRAALQELLYRADDVDSFKEFHFETGPCIVDLEACYKIAADEPAPSAYRHPEHELPPLLRRRPRGWLVQIFDLVWFDSLTAQTSVPPLCGARIGQTTCGYPAEAAMHLGTAGPPPPAGRHAYMPEYIEKETENG